MCVAQRIGGDLEHAVERPIHLHYEEYGAANRQRANEEDRNNHGVPRSEQPEARECDREPKTGGPQGTAQELTTRCQQSQATCFVRSLPRGPAPAPGTPAGSRRAASDPGLAAASRSAPNAAPELIGSRLAGLDEPCPQIMSIRAPTARCKPLRISPVSDP